MEVFTKKHTLPLSQPKEDYLLDIAGAAKLHFWAFTLFLHLLELFFSIFSFLHSMVGEKNSDQSVDF